MRILDEAAAALASLPMFAEVTAADIRNALYPPSAPVGADLTLRCFELAARLRLPVKDFARELAEAAERLPGFWSAKAAGPYLNLELERETAWRLVLGEVAEEGARFGNSRDGSGTIVLDYSSPNIAKPFHFGHLRSTNLGAALARIWEACGYAVWRQNHVGDWGTQFGLVIDAWQRSGNEEELKARAVDYLVELYVRASAEAEVDESVMVAARDCFRRLEEGDPELLALWARFREMSVEAFRRTYDRLGVRFDSYDGEAAQNSVLGAVIERFRRAGVATESNGATVVEVADAIGREIAPCMLRKTDGATTYAARDCAAALARWENHHFVANVYVVARQEDHFAQVFAALGKLAAAEGWPELWHTRCENVSFGFIRGMSTRKGTAVWLDDVLNEARDRAAAIRLEKERESPEAFPPLSAEESARVSEAVGQAAVLFFDVSAKRMTDLNFDWDRVLRFDGNSGPYLQYTYARLSGILRRLDAEGWFEEAMRSGTEVDCTLLAEEDVWPLAIRLDQFARVIQSAGRTREPHEIGRYLLELAGETNRFYNRCRILDREMLERSRARLAVVVAARQVLANGLRLLGIVPLEVM